MKTWGYSRATPGFYHEPDYPLEQQHADVQAFFTQTLVPAGYTELEILTDEASAAVERLPLRVAGHRLWTKLRRHEAIVCPRLSLFCTDPYDVRETVGTLHRRRLLLYFLDALPAPVQDSGKLLLLGLDAVFALNTAVWRQAGKESWDATAERHGGRHPFEDWWQRQAQRRAERPRRFLRWNEEKIRFVAHAKDELGWSWTQIMHWLNYASSCQRKGRPHWTLAELKRAYKLWKEESS